MQAATSSAEVLRRRPEEAGVSLRFLRKFVEQHAALLSTGMTTTQVGIAALNSTGLTPVD